MTQVTAHTEEHAETNPVDYIIRLLKAEDEAAVLWHKLLEVTPRTRGQRQRPLPAVLIDVPADAKALVARSEVPRAFQAP